jgi:RNA polymerase sigma-70 factor (ECF subfamily)
MSNRSPASEDFLWVLMRHEQRRAFVQVGLPRATDIDKVIQEVSLVAWRKFSTLADHDHLLSWLCLIARYQVLKYRRKFARDRRLLDNSMVELLAAEADSELPLRGRQLAAWADPVASFTKERRQLLKIANRSGQTVRALAKPWDRGVNWLYKTLVRIRWDLLAWIHHKLEAQG